ncbi:MAG: ABC-2 transporter permease [Agathobaculum sp.]|jgi:ABC-2 type transport system permease protein|uniref:ABC-2 transporter permease n=1 Tax=Agathobaculum sp. TaxID=2048138 RepID=UPI003D91A534
MKAMLYADWISLKQVLRSFLFAAVIIMGTGFLWNGPTFFVMGLLMLSILVPVSLCSADKAHGWDKLSLSMPVLRRDVVGSKFAVSGMANAAVLAIAVVLAAIYCGLHPEEDWMSNLAALLAGEAIALVMMGVDLCVSYKWGLEKARYILMGCVWLPMIGVVLLDKVGIGLPDLSWLELLNAAQIVGLAAGAVVVGLLVYLFCCMVSVRVYQRTEL